MRAIKFRAWYAPEKTMWDWNSMLSELSSWDKPFESTADWKVMQFTGLKDRDGMDIYEGDIVEWTHALGDPKACDSGKGAIHFHYGVFHTGNIDPLGNQFNGSGYPTNASIEMTVIGNVHQNPELLTSLAKPE